MLTNVVLSVIVIIGFMFVAGAAFLASEEKQYRYDINATDEHEV